jgi:hypothetical protein
MRQFVDRALDRSRATLVRDLRGILLRFAPIAGTPEAAVAALSRGSLGAEDLDKTGDFVANRATLSHMSLGEGRGP